MVKALRRFGWAAQLKCPNCGRAHIIRGWFGVTPICPACGFRLEREAGYFTGAMAINAVLAGALFLAAFAVVLALTLPDPPVLLIQVVAAAFMVAFPLAFWPFSRTFWIALDLTLDPKKSTDAGAHFNGKAH